MDTQEKIQFWKNEIERAEQYGFYFDTQSMREVINTVEEQQKEISDWKNIVKIHNENGMFLAEKVERYEMALKAYGDEEGKIVLKILDNLNREYERIESASDIIGAGFLIKSQDLTSICLKCGIDLGKCICNK